VIRWADFSILFMFQAGLIILAVVAYIIYRVVWWGVKLLQEPSYSLPA